MKTKKTYLILINAAFKMGQFHVNFGEYLKQNGNEVVYALTDKLPLYTEKLNLKDEKIYVFSDYFKLNYESKGIDEKYSDININKLFFSDFDRNIIHQEMPSFDQLHYESLMTNMVNFFDSIISDNKIDICIYESISNSFAYTAFEVMKANGIPYCGYAGSRLKGRFELFTEEFGSVDQFSSLFARAELTEAYPTEVEYVREFLSQYKRDSDMPTYHPKGTHLDWNHSLLKKYFNSDKYQLIVGAWKFMVNEYENIKYSYQIGNPFLELLRNFKLQIKKQVRIRFANKYFEKVIQGEKYYIYPQHFKPESSTSVLARHYCDDLAVITNIAFNLPFGTKLYVKEHFVNFGKLPTSYYKQLRKIPNVKLLSHGENMQRLLINSIGVITLTSTVGFEALLYNKPVFIFGNVFYQCHPNCFKIKSYDELEFALKNYVLKEENVNERFLLAYYRNTIEGNVYYNLPSERFTQADFNQRFFKAINEKFFN